MCELVLVAVRREEPEKPGSVGSIRFRCLARLCISGRAAYIGEAGREPSFFSGCPFAACFAKITRFLRGFGRAVSVERLACMMLELQEQGALNINLVTPMHLHRR